MDAKVREEARKAAWNEAIDANNAAGEGWVSSSAVDAAIDAYEAALEAAGYVMVPREPTEAMLKASGAEDGGEWYFGEVGDAHKAMRQVYRAMIAAATNPARQGE